MQSRVLHTLTEGVSVVGEDGHIIYTNSAEDCMLGYERGQLIGQHVSVESAYPAEETSRILEEVIATVSAGQTWTGEWVSRKKDGVKFLSCVRATQVDIRGKQYCVFVREDVRERKRAQELQRAVERQLTLLIEASGTLLASPESADVLRTILDLAKRFIDADAYSVWRKAENSDTWQIAAMEGLSEKYNQRITQHSREGQELPAEPVVIEDVENVPLVRDRIEAYKAEGIRSLITVPLRIHGEIAGTLVFYYRSPHRFTELETRVAAALGNLAAAALGTADLYNRETRLRHLAESEERRASFLAEASQALSSSLEYEKTLTSVVDLAVPAFADWASVDILEPSGEVRRVSVKHTDPAKVALAYDYRGRFPTTEDSAERVAIRTGKSILAEDIPDALLVERLTNPEQLQFIRELGLRSVIIAPLLASGRSFGVLTFVTAESGRQYTRADLALAEELARRAATAVDNARLFTESKNAQENLRRSNAELRRVNEDLNQFAYSASHDLQEPLRMMAVFSQMLERKYQGQLDARAHKYINFMVEGAKRMELLLKDLLAYTQSIHFAPQEITLIDANPVFESALSNLDAAIRESGADVTCGPLPYLYVHEIHLLQLFQNVIGNAIKYRTETRPVIQVTSEREGAEWKICVTDNGIGIAPEYRDQIFGLFKRLHSREEYEGTGIGLAICQKIVQHYGGRIWVESEEGKGSTFCFTLP
jgi:PAS domain S-box-containing protein